MDQIPVDGDSLVYYDEWCLAFWIAVEAVFLEYIIVGVDPAGYTILG